MSEFTLSDLMGLRRELGAAGYSYLRYGSRRQDNIQRQWINSSRGVDVVLDAEGLRIEAHGRVWTVTAASLGEGLRLLILAGVLGRRRDCVRLLVAPAEVCEDCWRDRDVDRYEAATDHADHWAPEPEVAA